jgi:hypothetical protein
MARLQDLAVRVYDRLEEDTFGAPIFWGTDETNAALVEGLFEAALISGEPQVRRTQPIAIAANQTLQPMPPDSIAIVRIESGGVLYKTSVWDLDQMVPDWEQKSADAATHWFPVGLTQCGVYPKLNAPTNAIFTVVAVPVAPALTYTGAEVIPFQEEYLSAFPDYADHVMRMKDSMQSFIDGFADYGKFLQSMSDLSKFGYRKGSLRFSRAVGSVSQVTQRETQG